MEKVPFSVKRPPLLIIDPDREFLEELKNDPEASANPPLVARSRLEAQRLLMYARHSFAGIFINPNITIGAGLGVIKTALREHAGTPIFLLSDGREHPLSSVDLERVAIQDVVLKPVNYGRLIELVTPLAVGFDTSEAMAIARYNEELLGEEIDYRDAHFFPIRALNFIAGRKSFFDIYLRVSNGRYVKLIDAGDSFTPGRLMNYLKEGISHLYLKREDQYSYLAYCDYLTVKVSRPGTSSRV
jgi:hypothetical protein